MAESRKNCKSKQRRALMPCHSQNHWGLISRRKAWEPVQAKTNLRSLYKARSLQKATFSVNKKKSYFTERNNRNSCLPCPTLDKERRIEKKKSSLTIPNHKPTKLADFSHYSYRQNNCISRDPRLVVTSGTWQKQRNTLKTRL